jgi:ATP-dependent helicase HepA
MVDCLRFVRKEAGPEAFRYIHDTRAPTLLPVLDTLARFGPCIERGTERRQLASQIPLQAGTFSRTVAEKAHVGLLRVGHPIFSALEALVRADDRGVAFAMWRQLPWFEGAPQLFLRFDFVIETDLRHALSRLASYAVSREAIKRRADDAFPIRYDTIWLDSDLNTVEDRQLITALELPYRRRSEGGRGDVNVRLERWDLVKNAVSIDDWEGLCRRGRRAAEQRLRESAELIRQCSSSAETVRDMAARVAESLQSRISRLSGASRAAEEQTAGFEAALSGALEKGMESPIARADSAGVVFLANKTLGA